MNCLLNKVGIIGCGDTTPASGLFINSFPGLSLKSIDSLATEEQADYIGVWNDVQNISYKRFLIDVANELGKRYKLNRITSSIYLEKIIDVSVTTPSAAQYRGIILDTDKDFSDSAYSKHSTLQAHYIQVIYYYSLSNVMACDIKIIDVITNTDLDVFIEDINIGWNTIKIDKSYSGRKIAVVINSTNINSVTLTVDNNIRWVHSCDSAINGFVYTIGSNPSTGTIGSNTFGMSIVYGVRCGYENLICNNQDVFYLAWTYLLAIELTVQRQFSSRINKWTLNQKEAESLRLYYEEEYKKTLQQICHSITLNEHDCCLECDGAMNIVEVKP